MEVEREPQDHRQIGEVGVWEEVQVVQEGYPSRVLLLKAWPTDQHHGIIWEFVINAGSRC